MCMSFYSLAMSRDKAYTNCLVSCPEVKRARKKNLVSVKVSCHKNLLKSRSCTWPTRTPEQHSAKRELFVSNHISFRIPLKFKACFSSTEI